VKKLSYTKLFVPGISLVFRPGNQSGVLSWESVLCFVLGISLVFCPRNYVRSNVYASTSGTQKNGV